GTEAVLFKGRDDHVALPNSARRTRARPEREPCARGPSAATRIQCSRLRWPASGLLRRRFYAREFASSERSSARPSQRATGFTALARVNPRMGPDNDNINFRFTFVAKRAISLRGLILGEDL